MSQRGKEGPAKARALDEAVGRGEAGAALHVGGVTDEPLVEAGLEEASHPSQGPCKAERRSTIRDLSAARGG
eukprot:12771695-Alexandrium_andersonii.AAC.1